MADNLLRGFGNPEQNVNYNHFDRSYHNPYTCKAGQEIPVCCIETDPGDKVQVSIAAMARSMPLTTPAFLRAKINFEWYFVPYSQLNHNWNSIFATVNEYTSATDQNVFTQADVDLPYLDLVGVLAAAQTAGATIKDIFGRDMRGDASKLLDMLDYGSYPLQVQQDGVTKALRLPVFMSNSVPLDVNPFRLQAYQKIWNCYHRDKYYDPIDNVSAQGYNTDDIVLGSGSTPSITGQRSYSGVSSEIATLQNMCALRYHRWKTDQFMGALPSRQDGVVSSVQLQGRLLFSDSQGQVDANNYLNVRLGVGGTVATGNNTVRLRNSSNTIVGDTQFTLENGLNVLALRQAEALQAWKENTLRAGKNMNKQFKAHTGFTPKFAMDNYPEFIGSFDANVAIDEVVSTTDSLTQNSGNIEGAQLGQLAGKGISVTGKNEIKYFARDHGILMCIAYILPDVSYNNTGVSPFNTKLRRSSYYIKEFENTGLVPIMRRDLDVSLVSTSQQMNSVLGYLPYGYEYKTNYDRLHGELMYNRSLQSWAPSRKDLIQAANAIPAAGGLNKGVRYVNPSILDPVFAYNVDETEASDQFIVNLYNDVKVLSNKSVLGLPKY